MNDNENRKYQMFARVHIFGLEHSADFAVDSMGAQLFATLSDIIDSLDQHASAKVSRSGMAFQGTASRGEARQALREDLEAINRTARAMSADVPGLDDKFRMPPHGNDQLLLNAARAFHTDATPLKTQFIAHELPADFLEDLLADIEALEAAMATQSTGVGQRVAAGAAIESALEQGGVTVRKLDAIIKNKYRNNAAVLAQWTSASHTERAPRRQSQPAGDTPAQPPTQTGGPTPGPGPTP